MSACVYDEKVNKVFELLAQGKSKDEIAHHFGHSWQGVDIYLKRKGFRWNGTTFVEKMDNKPKAIQDVQLQNNKAGHIVRQLGCQNANIRQVALKNGFSSVQELGGYMKGQGYVWDNKQNNYEYDESMARKIEEKCTSIANIPSIQEGGGMDAYLPLLARLVEKQKKLFELLEDKEVRELPMYVFKGAKANKTLSFPQHLAVLLNDFSKEYNVTQRAIVEIALVDFFRTYGFREQIDSIINA